MVSRKSVVSKCDCGAGFGGHCADGVSLDGGKDFMKTIGCVGWIILMFAASVLAEAPATQPRRVAKGVTQLFVDDELIESALDVRRTLHQPKKDHDGNEPVLALQDEFGGVPG